MVGLFSSWFWVNNYFGEVKSKSDCLQVFKT